MHVCILRIIEWIGLEGTYLKDHLVSTPCAFTTTTVHTVSFSFSSALNLRLLEAKRLKTKKEERMV